MSEAQRKILAEMTRTAAADGHYDTADEFIQTRELCLCDDCTITDYHEAAERDIHGNRL